MLDHESYLDMEMESDQYLPVVSVRRDFSAAQRV
jgi:hypothetical protein